MRHQVSAAAITVSCLLVTTHPVLGQENGEMSLDDFQNTINDYVKAIGSDELVNRFHGLTYDDWIAMYDSFPNKGKFAAAAKKVEARAAEAGSSQLFAQSQDLSSALITSPAAEFTPRYPAGQFYDIYVETLPGWGLLYDGDLPGTQDDRCDASGEAETRIATEALEFSAIVLDGGCNTVVTILGEGTNAPFCIAAAAVHTAARASQIILEQCGYQTALVDSAEIEAAYENTRRIIGTLNNVDAQLATHDSDVKAILATIQEIVTANGEKLDLSLARQLETIRLLTTPEGLRSTDVPACNGGPCTWVGR
jgi:hypothetical protein